MRLAEKDLLVSLVIIIGGKKPSKTLMLWQHFPQLISEFSNYHKYFQISKLSEISFLDLS